MFYEKNVAEGFLPSLPYERLRILYAKWKDYENAIRVCQRYIEILQAVSSFWPNYSNIRLIPKYKQEIEKLASKSHKLDI
jgi:hypothetical protein